MLRRPRSVFRLFAFALVFAAGCGSAVPQPPGRDPGATEGFARATAVPWAVAPAVPGPGLQPAPAGVERIGAILYDELLVMRADALVGPDRAATRLAEMGGAGDALTSVVRTLARGERTVPSDYRVWQAAFPGAMVLLSWIDETAVAGREAVRTDREPTDLRADDALARYRAIEGRVEVRLVDPASGQVVWRGHEDYATPPVFDGSPAGEELQRLRAIAAVTVARRLETDAQAHTGAAALD